MESEPGTIILLLIKSSRCDYCENFKPNDRIRVIEGFFTDDGVESHKKELKVGDILVIKRKDSRGNIVVYKEDNSWNIAHWIIPRSGIE